VAARSLGALARRSHRYIAELTVLKVGFVSLSEALDLTTPSGRAFTGMLAVFAEFERDILRDRVKAGIAQARKEGRPHGRPAKIIGKTQEIRNLARKGLSKSAIAKQLNIGRTSVRRLLADALLNSLECVLEQIPR
jgi:putative DNA-invertase from lambdoid prophage Rac